MSKTCFTYYNPHPMNAETGDCVIRALCKATDREWVSIYDELCAFGRDIYELPNAPDTTTEFFTHNGFIKETVPRAKKGCESLSVREFCRTRKSGTFILKCAHHLVCVKDGICYDLNINVLNSKVYTYWRKL